MASKMNTAAAATYAQPRNGFFPPIQETVEITTDFVPLYGSTGKLRLTVMKYVPFCNVSPSFRPHSFVNVGKPLVLIQFWKCSFALRSGGGVELL